MFHVIPRSDSPDSTFSLIPIVFAPHFQCSLLLVPVALTPIAPHHVV